MCKGKGMEIMKKALLVTTVSGFVPQFEMDNVRLLQAMGYEVHYAANYNMPVYSSNNDRLEGTGIIRHQIDFVRSPYHIGKNIMAYRQLNLLMKNEIFDLVHCHTPMGGVLARLSAKVSNTGPVLYTAHGFHFFRGASFLKWALYYPVERYLAHYTDVLITMNKEDYSRAKKFKTRKGNGVKYIPGVGIERRKIKNDCMEIENVEEIRMKYGLKKDDFLISSSGELTKRKNHEVMLKAIGALKEKFPNIKYIICGTGVLDHKLRNIVKKLDLGGNIIFAGYCLEIEAVLTASDCFAFPSIQEGLPVALMEAMASGLPVVCSKIRGNVDLIKDGKGGYLIEKNSAACYAEKLEFLIRNKDLRCKMGEWNQEKIKRFDKERVRERMKKIYNVESFRSN